MGGSTRIAAVAAVSHGRQLYNYTHHDVYRGEGTQYNVNVFFIGATLCGVIVAVCAVCWRRAPSADKPEDLAPNLAAGVYTVSADTRLHHQFIEEVPGPPPAYDSVVHNPDDDEAKDYEELQEVVTEACPSCQVSSPPDAEPPSYEAAVLLRDTKL